MKFNQPKILSYPREYIDSGADSLVYVVSLPDHKNVILKKYFAAPHITNPKQLLETLKKYTEDTEKAKIFISKIGSDYFNNRFFTVNKRKLSVSLEIISQGIPFIYENNVYSYGQPFIKGKHFPAVPKTKEDRQFNKIYQEIQELALQLSHHLEIRFWFEVANMKLFIKKNNLTIYVTDLATDLKLNYEEYRD